MLNVSVYGTWTQELIFAGIIFSTHSHKHERKREKKRPRLKKNDYNGIYDNDNTNDLRCIGEPQTLCA